MGVVWIDNHEICRVYGMLRRRTWKWAVLIFNIASASTNPKKITNELGQASATYGTRAKRGTWNGFQWHDE